MAHEPTSSPTVSDRRSTSSSRPLYRMPGGIPFRWGTAEAADAAWTAIRHARGAGAAA